MKLWLILTAEDYEQLQRDGVYRITETDFVMECCQHAYGWLNAEMEKRVGPPPEETVAPIHGWLRWEVERPRPDLRWMRWNWGSSGEYVLMQIDIPEEHVIFIDSEAWTTILNKMLICNSEEEHDRLWAEFDALPASEKEKMLRENWKRVFDIEYVKDAPWRNKGWEVEAVFWELRKDQVRSAKRFTSNLKKMYRSNEDD